MKLISHLKITTDFNLNMYISLDDEIINLIKLKPKKLTDMFEGNLYFEFKNHNYNKYIKQIIEQDDEWDIKYEYYDIENNCIVYYKQEGLLQNNHKWTKLWINKNTNKITNINPFEKPLNIDKSTITIYI